MKLTALFEKVPEGYIAFVEELPGANAQGDSLEETKHNLLEAIKLIFQTNRLATENMLKGHRIFARQMISI